MNCKNCKYSKFHLTEKGNIRTSVSGKCTYEIIIPKLPYSAILGLYGSKLCFRKISISAKYSVECECFEPKE